MLQELQSIKLQLHDAPVEVKESYNKVVNYFGVVGAIKGAFKGVVKNARIGSLEADIKKQKEKLDKYRENKLEPTRREYEKMKEKLNQMKEELQKLKSQQ